jgi:hypothetical protein
MKQKVEMQSNINIFISKAECSGKKGHTGGNAAQMKKLGMNAVWQK